MQFINHLYIHRCYPCSGHSMYLCNAYNAFLPHFSCKCNGHLHLAHKHWNHLLYQGCDTYILQNKQNKQSHWYAHLITKFNFSFFFCFSSFWLHADSKLAINKVFTQNGDRWRNHISFDSYNCNILWYSWSTEVYINSPLKALKQDWTTLNELLLMKFFEKKLLPCLGNQ